MFTGRLYGNTVCTSESMNMNNMHTDKHVTTPTFPTWVMLAMDVWLVTGVISLLLALWFLPFDSPWRATGWLMLEYGLMLCASALMLRWQFTRQQAQRSKAIHSIVLLLFLYLPTVCLGCVSPCCGRHRNGDWHSAPYNTFFGNTMAGC